MKQLRIFYKTILMDLKSTFRYRFGIVTDILTMTLLLSFFFISDTGSSLENTYGFSNPKSLLLLGYILWNISVSIISTLSNEINIEARNGTLPNLFYSKAPIELILFARTISALLVNIIVILVMVLFSNLIFGVKLDFSFEIIPPILICIVGMFGLGLTISGISVYFKKVGSLVLLIQIGMLFVTDTLYVEDGISQISRFIPLTHGNDILRKIASGISYGDTLTSLIIMSFLWLVIGIVSLRFFINRAKSKGNLVMF